MSIDAMRLQVLVFLAVSLGGCGSARPSHNQPPAPARALASVSASVSAPSPRQSEAPPLPVEEAPPNPPPNIVALSAADRGSCAVDNQGHLYCWGMGVPDARGDGHLALRPVRVTGIDDAVAVRGGGDDTTCVMRRSHPLTCRGIGVPSADYGRSWTELPMLRPERVEDIVSVQQSVCVIGRNRKASCVNHRGPAELVPQGWSGIRSLVADGSTLIGITSKGLACVGKEASLCPLPSASAPGGLSLKGLRQLSSAEGTTCALGASEVKCWGTHIDQYSEGAGWQPDSPRALPDLVGAQQLVVLSGGRVCGRFSEGKVLCTTIRDHGKEMATRVMIASGATELVGGDHHACVLMQGGAVRCWGDARDGRLGDNSLDFVATPRPIAGVVGAVRVWASTGTYVQQSSGPVQWYGLHGYGVARGAVLSEGPPSDEVVMCPRGQYDSHVIRRGPKGSVRCPDEGFETAKLVMSDAESLTRLVCGLFGDGTIRCKGIFEAVDAMGGPRLAQYQPHQIAVRNATGLRMGSKGACALLADGSAKCIAIHGREMLGVAEGLPIVVPSGRAIRDIAWTRDSACALDAAGNVYCDSDDGTQELRQVRGLAPIKSLAAGTRFLCALSEAGQVQCWGENGMGQLGAGDNLLHDGVVQSVGLSRIVELVADREHACARGEDGRVFCWGDNSNGQCGQPVPNRNSEPVSPMW